MSFGWKKYVEDYEEGKDGKYVYVGRYYCFFLEKQQLHRFRVAYACMAACAVVLFLLAGFNEYASSRTWYVVAPYAACAIPVALLVLYTLRICRAPERMTRKQYNESVPAHKGACIALLVLSLATVAGDSVFLARYCPAELRMQELVFLLCCIGLLLGAALWLFLASRLPSGAEGSQK